MGKKQASKNNAFEPTDDGPKINITPEMREMYEKAKREAMGEPVFTSDQNETVPKLRFDNLEAEYKKEKKDWADEKKRLKKELTDSKKEIQKLSSQVKEKDKTIESLNEKLKTSTDNLKKANGEIEDLRKQLKEKPVETVVKQDDAKIDELNKKLEAQNKELEEKKGENGSLNAKIEELEGQITALKQRIDELEQENSNLKNGSGYEEGSESDSVGCIEWASPTQFRSPLFKDGRYSVKLARSGEYITFTPDVEGKAICCDQSIEIPSLSRYLTFQKRSYEAFVHENSIRILLRQ